MSVQTTAKGKMALACILYGSLGVMRRGIPLTSGLISFTRAVIAVVFLLLFLHLRGRRLSLSSVRANLRLLIPCGIAMGVAWVCLFEAYNHTTVAIATLTFYFAPTIVILASPVVLHEKLTAKKLICAAIAFAGMVLISGVTGGAGTATTGMKGILLALAAACLYATNTLLSKQLRDITPMDTAATQLFFAALTLLPYLLWSGGFEETALTPFALFLLLILGVLHTSFAYTLHFDALSVLSSQTASLLGYIDPVTAVALSVLFLREPLTLPVFAGAVMILVSAYVAS